MVAFLIAAETAGNAMAEAERLVAEEAAAVAASLLLRTVLSPLFSTTFSFSFMVCFPPRMGNARSVGANGGTLNRGGPTSSISRSSCSLSW
mgnify:CR=1 FL=1